MKPIKNNGLFGLENNNGEVLVPCKYDEVGDYIVWEDDDSLPSTPCVSVCLKDKWALRQFGMDDVYMTDFEYDDIQPFDETYLYLAIKDSGISVYDVLGEKVFDEEFDRIRNPQYSIALVQKNGLFGMFTDDGLRLVKPQFSEIKEPNYGEYFRVKKDGKWGWIDSSNSFTEDESEAWWGYCDDFFAGSI